MGRECWSWCRTTSASGVADYVLQLADHGMALLSLDVSTTEDVSPICVSAAFHDLFTKAGSDCLQRQRRFVPPFCRAFFVLSVLYRVLPCSVRTHMFSCRRNATAGRVAMPRRAAQVDGRRSGGNPHPVRSWRCRHIGRWRL